MGLDIRIKGMTYEETYSGGYLTFNLYRLNVAKAYNNEIGELYKKSMIYPYTSLSDEEFDRWNKICNDDLDLFLLHSDCDGKLTWKECRAIYKVMKDLKVDMQGHNYGMMNVYDMHTQWLNMFKFCWKRRVTMWFL